MSDQSTWQFSRKMNTCATLRFSAFQHTHSSGLAKTILLGTVKRGRRQGRQKKAGRQHQGMDRPGVHQVPEGSGEQRKMEETGGEVLCGAPTNPAVKG